MHVGIWLPVYGGWLRTTHQTSAPHIPTCLAIAQQAEAIGFDFLYASENLLNCIHGPQAGVADAWSLLGAIGAKTSRIGIVGAVKPGFRSPFLMARMIDTLTQIAGRRLAVNVVCGWWRREFELSGVPYLDHAGRYERADAFLRDFYSLFNPPVEMVAGEEGAEDADADPTLSPRQCTYGLEPASLPEMWVCGHSRQATEMAAEWADCLFLNGMSDSDLAQHIISVKQAAQRWNRKISIAVNAYVIAAETREQALARRAAVLKQIDREKIAFFREIMADSGAAAWDGLSDQQMIDSNAGFEANLIGSFHEVRARLDELAEVGVDTVVCQFDDPMRDAGPFMKHVIEPMRAETVAAIAEPVPAAAEPAGQNADSTG
jgi:dimethylsulfone monooxygenase